CLHLSRATGAGVENPRDEQRRQMSAVVGRKLQCGRTVPDGDNLMAGSVLQASSSDRADLARLGLVAARPYEATARIAKDEQSQHWKGVHRPRWAPASDAEFAKMRNVEKRNGVRERHGP